LGQPHIGYVLLLPGLSQCDLLPFGIPGFLDTGLAQLHPAQQRHEKKERIQ
jgi:hypothetical protein